MLTKKTFLYQCSQFSRMVFILDAYKCVDCRIDTAIIEEYYMVRREIWERCTAINERSKMLCIGCLEKRLGRTLIRSDFIDCLLNQSLDNKSVRLMCRYQQTRKAG